MIEGAVFCPHPPILIREAAQGAAPELDDLRDACCTAIRRLAAPDRRWMAVGAGPLSGPHPATARGSMAGFGVPVEVPLGSDEPGALELPLSLTIGAWLLREALGPDTGAVGWSIGPDRGHDPDLFLPDDDAKYVLLVMGDGSARRSTTAPGYLDERAAGFDDAVAAALRSGRGDRLRFDAALGAELLVAGVGSWAAAAALLQRGEFEADLLYAGAPYGVGYFVAAWTRRD